MRRFLRSTAIGLALAVMAPAMKAPDPFVYRSAQAENAPDIPSWIQASCCGPSDVHRLRPDQVSRISDAYYQVDGYREPIPSNQAKPSQDANYWIFYREISGGMQSPVYCFFVPMAF